ncbi:MAG: DUF2577 domain-containing protein [Clostridiales bacterium]|nr:DUF2577 domain-containing protein [Clostridiales bacterium]
MNLTETIKRIALDAAQSSRPFAKLVFGIVINTAPLEISIDQKITLTSDFFVLTKAAKQANMAKGDHIAMIQEQGGQRFLILDKVVSA